jgi:iron complex transport system substrate-binding protein
MLMIMSLLVVPGCAKSPQEPASTVPANRVVVDLAGRSVTIPASPKKVATMQGPTYEMLFMLGAKDQIGLVRDDHTSAYPLATLTNPDLAKYPSIADVGPQTPINVEEFIAKGVDLVIYWNIPQELEKFEKAGIPVIVGTETGPKAQNLEEAVAGTKKQFAFMADALGGNAPKHYAEWAAYYDKTVALIQSRTADIPQDQIPVVYWGNTWNTNILSTYQLYPRIYEVALCGGKLVSAEKGGQFPEINKEQLLAWKPGVIVVDNHGRNPEKVIDELKSNPDWAPLPAVKNDRIYRIPAGVFFLDKGSARPLYYYWLAKQLHPDKFQDVDLIKEMQYYYKTFYNYELSTAEAENVLAGWVKGI